MTPTTAATPRRMESPARTRRSSRAERATATRPMILDAAREIARADGWPAVTIRRVADALGYTSPLIYEHFRDKGDALAAILNEGFGALAAAMAAAAARPLDPADPDAYAHGVCDAYLAFARREPAVYQLMHGMGGVALDPAETMRGAQLVCEVGVEALQTWAAAAHVVFPDPVATTEGLWCALHGVTCVALAGRLEQPHDAYAEDRLRGVVGALLAGWRVLHGAGPAA